MDEKQATIDELQHRLHSLEPLHELQTSIDSQKWEEFSRMAASMKTLSLRTQQRQPRGQPANHSATSRGRPASSSLEYS